jgi:hypothetical protein
MESPSKTHPLPVQRIAVTAPPVGWFYGVAQTLFDHYRQALVDLGLSVFDVPVDAFLPPDTGRIAKVREDLQAFRPQLVLGLPYGSYALLCRLPARRDGWQPNLFLDVLDLPTVCIWDHAPVELADQLLAPHPAGPAASTAGALESLRRVLRHPRLIHWSRDSGQTRIMKDLGFLLPDHVIHEMSPALPGFGRPPAATLADDAKGVAFVGRLYQRPADHPHAALAALAEESTQAWLGHGQTLWDELECRIERLPTELRRELALDHDQTYFWRFAHGLILHQAQTSLRLTLLGAAGVPVTCYGNLEADLRGVPQNLLAAPDSVTYGPQLAAIFARHAITIDVLNPGFVHGYSHKQVHGFSTGGFMLMNRKQDFVDAFGEPGEAVSFADGDELQAKVDRFLSSPKYRREVGDAIRETIAARFELKDVLYRALTAAMRCVEAMGPSRTGTAPVSNNRSQIAVMDLLPWLRTEPYWPDAAARHVAGGVLLTTGPQAWAYAAAIAIPPRVKKMNEPHLRLILAVDVGRLGLAALRDDTGTLLGEQVVSSRQPVTVTIELPREGVSNVILRNTVERVSRVLVSEATLCDRER